MLYHVKSAKLGNSIWSCLNLVSNSAFSWQTPYFCFNSFDFHDATRNSYQYVRLGVVWGKRDRLDICWIFPVCISYDVSQRSTFSFNMPIFETIVGGGHLLRSCYALLRLVKRSTWKLNIMFLQYFGSNIISLNWGIKPVYTKIFERPRYRSSVHLLRLDYTSVTRVGPRTASWLLSRVKTYTCRTATLNHTIYVRVTASEQKVV